MGNVISRPRQRSCYPHTHIDCRSCRLSVGTLCGPRVAPRARAVHRPQEFPAPPCPALLAMVAPTYAARLSTNVAHGCGSLRNQHPFTPTPFILPYRTSNFPRACVDGPLSLCPHAPLAAPLAPSPRLARTRHSCKSTFICLMARVSWNAHGVGVVPGGEGWGGVGDGHQPWTRFPAHLE